MVNARTFFIYALCLVLTTVQTSTLALPRALASESVENTSAQENTQSFFVTTEGVQTPRGKIHLEIQSYKVDSADTLATAQSEITDKLASGAKVNQFFTLPVQSDTTGAHSLDSQVREGVEQIVQVVNATELVQSQPVTVEAVKERGKFRLNYTYTLGLIRGVVNGGTVFAGLVIGKDIPMEHALVMGLLAGAVSGTIQVKSEALFNWLKNSVLLVNAAKRLRLIPQNSGLEPSRAERVLTEVQMYSKWATLEAGFLLICQTAMSLMNIPITENLLITTAKSTASQGVFEVGVLKASEQLAQINPAWARHSQIFKQVSVFGGSSISVLAAIGTMVGMPFSNLGFAVLTASGLLLMFSSKIALREPVQRILQKMAARSEERARGVVAQRPDSRLETPVRTPRSRSPQAPARTPRAAAMQCRALVTGI